MPGQIGFCVLCRVSMAPPRQWKFHDNRGVGRPGIIFRRCVDHPKSEFSIERDHAPIALPRVGDDASKAVMPGITDLPGFYQTAEAVPLECRENACGADVE